MTVVESAAAGVWEDPWMSVPVIGAGVGPEAIRQEGELVAECAGDELAVHCDGAGVPREVVHHGRVHRVVEPPVRWYERRNWWETEGRAPRESRTSMVDRELWQVQALQRGARVARTFRLARCQVTDRWRLLGVSCG